MNALVEFERWVEQEVKKDMLQKRCQDLPAGLLRWPMRDGMDGALPPSTMWDEDLQVFGLVAAQKLTGIITPICISTSPTISSSPRIKPIEAVKTATPEES